jgi:hypothetical protein
VTCPIGRAGTACDRQGIGPWNGDSSEAAAWRSLRVSISMGFEACLVGKMGNVCDLKIDVFRRTTRNLCAKIRRNQRNRCNDPYAVWCMWWGGGRGCESWWGWRHGKREAGGGGAGSKRERRVPTESTLYEWLSIIKLAAGKGRYVRGTAGEACQHATAGGG